MSRAEVSSEGQEDKKSCAFCEPEYRESAFLDTDLFYAVFDANPVSPGHSLVIPKRHIVGFLDLGPGEWEGLFPTIQEAIAKIESTDLKTVYKAFIESGISETSVRFCQDALNHERINSKPDAYNHGINDGVAAGRTVNHLHWHIIPRFEGDVPDPRGGVRFVIPEKGNYKAPQT